MAHPLVRSLLPICMMLCFAEWPVRVAAEPAAHTPLRDPMQVPAPPAAASPTGESHAQAQAENDRLPLLASIRRTEREATRALIDGQWLTTGSIIRNWRVRAIGADSVVLQSVGNPGETRTLLLHQLSIRRAGVAP